MEHESKKRKFVRQKLPTARELNEEWNSDERVERTIEHIADAILDANEEEELWVKYKAPCIPMRVRAMLKEAGYRVSWETDHFRISWAHMIEGTEEWILREKYGGGLSLFE
jgi:hypothetical protein